MMVVFVVWAICVLQVFDAFFYSITPEHVLNRYNKFWRQVLIGSGIYIYIRYKISAA